MSNLFLFIYLFNSPRPRKIRLFCLMFSGHSRDCLFSLPSIVTIVFNVKIIQMRVAAIISTCLSVTRCHVLIGFFLKNVHGYTHPVVLAGLLYTRANLAQDNNLRVDSVSRVCINHVSSST